MQRRKLAALVAGAALALAPCTSAWSADTFPSKPLRLIVGFAPGGGADALTRIIAEGLSKQLGQQVVVENRPGADGVLAAQAVSSANADGYTLLMGTNTAMVAAPTLRPKPPYDPFKAFTPISSAGQFSMFLVVPSSLPAKSVSELLALVAAKPGDYNSASSNSASELAMLQLLGEQRKVVNARYKGDMQAMTDLLGGQIHMMFTTGTLAPNFVKEGRIRALVTLQRIAAGCAHRQRAGAGQAHHHALGGVLRAAGAAQSGHGKAVAGTAEHPEAARGACPVGTAGL
jgi:tripartite-type tricarboxylate transporter receptor subunit TctC